MTFDHLDIFVKTKFKVASILRNFLQSMRAKLKPACVHIFNSGKNHLKERYIRA